ncbi:hypothetical protein Pla163_11770 [Planctomycetes bacterium Pla163]|uniref:Uncharacterized protein n=1 Tax=Rohdeia mirabilis TaxID=2528008 RepID=A0A518CXY6_9BACT|nr:hypothetical protein Pla163_11770 [Planctomycetes bacterium Pla163]
MVTDRERPERASTNPVAARRTARRRERRAALVGASLWLALACSCAGEDGSTPPAVSGPVFGGLAPGVVIEVGGQPITEEEVERATRALESFFPHESAAHRQRRAVVDHALPRAANAARAPKARAEAEQRARALAAAVANGDADALATLVPARIPAFELDLWVWEAVREAPAGAVIGPVEDGTGSYVVAVVERPYDPAETLEQELGFRERLVPYDPRPESPLIPVVEGLEIRFAEARWRALVPTGVLHAMVEPSGDRQRRP